MLNHNPYIHYRHYPYHLHDPYMFIDYQAAEGLNSLWLQVFLYSFFLILVWIYLEQRRNHPTLTSWVEPAYEVATQESSYASVEGVVDKHECHVNKNVTKRMDGLMRKTYQMAIVHVRMYVHILNQINR